MDRTVPALKTICSSSKSAQGLAPTVQSLLPSSTSARRMASNPGLPEPPSLVALGLCPGIGLTHPAGLRVGQQSLVLPARLQDCETHSALPTRTWNLAANRDGDRECRGLGRKGKEVWKRFWGWKGRLREGPQGQWGKDSYPDRAPALCDWRVWKN